MTTRRTVLVWLSAGLAGCEKAGLPAPGSARFKGIDVTGADYRFKLPDIDGRTRDSADFKGKVTAVFFGYTQCPDVCPTALADLTQVKKSLGPDGERLQVVFITVDPERDTPQILKGYVGSFDPSHVALRGTPEQTAEVARNFKVFFAKAPGKSSESYTVDHTAGIYLFDPQGRVRVFERYGSGVEVLAADVKTLLAAG